MKLRTSFCKSALVKKDITRFAPIWVLYTVFVLLFMLTNLRSDLASRNARYLETGIRVLAVVNMIYGLLNAVLLFGDLFKTRLCYALHAMPISRTHQFWSHVTAGILFSLMPNVAASLAVMPMLGKFWYVALLWLLGALLSYVYFFAVATLCMMLTGNRFASVAVYAIINSFSYVVLWFLSSVFLPLMPGVELEAEIFAWFCPVELMMLSSDLFSYQYRSGGITEGLSDMIGIGMDKGWITFGIFGLVGVGLLVLALVLYRRRALEKAGDFLAVRWLEPIFLVIYTLFVGAFLVLFAEEEELLILFLAIGLLIGYFTGRMLIERTVRVLHKRAFAGIAVLALVIGIALGATKLDVFGIVRYVPEVEDVEKVWVYGNSTNGYCQIELTDLTDLMLVEQVHQTVVDHVNDEDTRHFVRLQLTYTLKNGHKVRRNYRVYSSAVENGVEKLYKLPKAILGFSDPEEAAKALNEVGVYKAFSSQQGYIHYSSNFQGLLEALYQDCLEGNITSETVVDKENALYMVQYELHSSYVCVGKEATHTVAWLDDYFGNLEGVTCTRVLTDEEIYLSATAKREIAQLLNNATWIDELTDCEGDYLFCQVNWQVEYHSECGTFRDVENGRAWQVSETQRLKINGYLGLT